MDKEHFEDEKEREGAIGARQECVFPRLDTAHYTPKR